MANAPEVIDLDAEIYEANRMAFTMLLRRTIEDAKAGQDVAEQVEAIEAAYYAASRSSQRMIGMLRTDTKAA